MSVKTCPRCGRPAKPDDLNCLECGYEYRFRVLGAVPEHEPADLPDGNIHIDRRHGPLLFLFVGIMAATLLGIFWSVSHPRRSEPLGPPPALQQPLIPPVITSSGEPPQTEKVLEADYNAIHDRIMPLMNEMALTPEVATRVLHEPMETDQIGDVSEMGWRCTDGWVYICFRNGLGFQIANKPYRRIHP